MFESFIINALEESLKELYQIEISIEPSAIQRTRKEFKGDFTLVVFSFAKITRKNPEQTAAEIGQSLFNKLKDKGLESFNVVKGFLNLSFSENVWKDFFEKESVNQQFGIKEENKNNAPILIEYSSPNTNKPLHLGHVRNNLLGNSISKILKACGEKVIQVNLVNDRGIHICKSMLAWLKYGNEEIPETSGLKGDHLVGKYYVEFDKHYKQQIKKLQNDHFSEEEAKRQAPLLLEAQKMLKLWEEGDENVRNLWTKMNAWVYEGFEKTYQRLGIHFDKTYYESNTYLLGKEVVQQGLDKHIFFQKEDGSVWADLTQEGLDEKLLLRSDGTSVYITQDLGTALLRYEEFHPKKMIYIVGNEQIYHFEVLKLILQKKMQLPAGESIFHLSYGMVELPDGKMKSREGTVVDADDLMEEMYQQAKDSTEALRKFDFTSEEAAALYEMIGLGALKYFILKVDPKKNILFNPQESIDFNGNTAPFIQYTHARIRSLFRKVDETKMATINSTAFSFSEVEKNMLRTLYEFPSVVTAAGMTYNPGLIANYVYDLAKEFNAFYQEIPIFKEKDENLRIFRLQLSQFTANVIKNGMNLLGIDVPDRM
jgi:arginyl-tRNA synthetase